MWMLILVLALVLTGLVGVVWATAYFGQGFFYTEIRADLFWRAPTAGGAIWLVTVVWPMAFNSMSSAVWPVSFNQAIFFSNTRVEAEFKEIILTSERGRETRYTRVKTPGGRVEYRDAETRTTPLPTTLVRFVAITADGSKLVFKSEKDHRDQTIYRDGQGRVMTEDSFGRITTSSYGQVFVSLTGLVLGWAAWFCALWLIVLFQWSHALGLAIPLHFVGLFVMNFVSL